MAFGIFTDQFILRLSFHKKKESPFADRISNFVKIKYTNFISKNIRQRDKIKFNQSKLIGL